MDLDCSGTAKQMPLPNYPRGFIAFNTLSKQSAIIPSQSYFVNLRHIEVLPDYLG